MTKPTLYIHIGPHKTGTTTIQHNLSENRPALKALGYIYPQATVIRLGQHNLVGEINNMFWFSPEYGVLEDLKREICGKGKQVILSSETFFEVEKPGPLRRIHKAFASEFDIKIIPYLRHQHHLLPSLWKSHLTVSRTNDPFHIWLEEQLRNNQNLHYDKWLRSFETVFGRKNIHPQIYEPRNPKHFFSFLAACGIEDTADFKKVGNRNVSTSDYHARLYVDMFLPRTSADERAAFTAHMESSPEFMDIMRRTFGKEKHIAPRVITETSRFLNDHNIDQTGSIFNRQTLSTVREKYKASNRKLSRKYFGRDNVFLSDPPSEFIENNYLRRLSKTQLVELCNLMFMTYRREGLDYAKRQKIKTGGPPPPE